MLTTYKSSNFGPSADEQLKVELKQAWILWDFTCAQKIFHSSLVSLEFSDEPIEPKANKHVLQASVGPGSSSYCFHWHSLVPEPSSPSLNPAQAQLEGDARIFVLLQRFVDGIEKFRN